ncbi:MAG: hypothetical protein GY710_06880 [Desulfobacteraceae bacterium]|nr:hypothetical protein [Desulfobacteraceae bacterium]
MGTEVKIYESVPPIVLDKINDKTNIELTDYFCPFCNYKLFRGNVIEFNIVCSQCNKLVRSAIISTPEEDSE